MGVYIKKMKMPKACVYRENGHLITCPLYDIDGYCGALHTQAIHKENGKLSDCPLVPVQPHGRLIDADALMQIIREHDYPLKAHFNSTDNGMFTIGIQQAVDEAPTIIPAEEGE